MSEELRKALESVPAEDFAKIVPQRRAIVEAAPDQEPVWEYQTNRVAKALHPEKQYVTIAKITDRPGAKSYTLVPDPSLGTESLAYFRAGQYVSVDLEIGSSVLTRAYTLACSPGDALRGSYTLTIKRNQDGFASNFIHDNWKEGMKLSVSGPDGDLNYEPLRDAKQIVGLAGGSGITPFFSLANAIKEGIEDCSLTLLYGCRSEEEIVYREELDALAAACEKFQVVYVLSDEEKAGFEHGFLTAELIQKYAPEGDYSIFMCGPQAMYRFCDKEVEKLGLPRRRVRHEAYGEYHNADRDDGFPQDAVGKTFQLTVELPDGQRVIPARSGESLLVALERAGIHAPSKCRSGECGFCRSRLGYGSVYVPSVIEYRRGADKKDGFVHPCCSFPTSDCQIFINCDKGEVERKVKDMKKKEKRVSLIMSVILSAVMGALATTLARRNMNPQALASAPAAGMYLASILESVAVGVLLMLVAPFGKWGRALAAKHKAFPPTMKFTMLNCLPISVGCSTIVGCVVSFINTAQAHAKIPPQAAPPLLAMWLPSWLKLLPLSILVSYVLAVLISPFVVQAVGLGGPPAGAGPGGPPAGGPPRN